MNNYDVSSASALDDSGQSLAIAFDHELTAGLKALSQRHGTTLHTTLLAAWGALITRLSGQDEVVIGTPVANRTRAEVEPLIGAFVNTLALRLDVSDRPSVSQLLTQVRDTVLHAQRHQDVPFEQVVEALKPERTLAHSPIFPLMFAWQDTQQTPFELGDLGVEHLAPQSVDAKFDLTLELQEAGGRIIGTLCFASALFDPQTMQRHLGYLDALLRGMVREDAQAIDAIAITGETERQQLLVDWNDTACDYPQEHCVHELFESHADRTPQALALAFPNGTMSYGALDEQANQLAHHLRAHGVGPDARVAICMPSGADRVVAVLATWKAGGAYVPLDPAYPAERLDYLLRDSAPVVVLTHAGVSSSVRDTLRAGLAPQAMLLDVHDDREAWCSRPLSRLSRDETGLQPHHLAYVIYTSGSTGQPKGVMVEHRGVCNLAAAQLRAFGVDPESRILQCASFSFDACLFEMVMALSNGASLHLPPAGAIVAGAMLNDLLAEHRVTHVTLTPSVLAGIDDPACMASVRTLVVAGEACAPALVERWAPGRCFINAYGPTETTVWATWHVCQSPMSGRPPIGRPIANTQVYVLDAARQPVPVGVEGELYIGGAGVARGYLGRPELTSERFVHDPFASQPGARLYKTGDMVRWLANGTLDYLGRNDDQVKIRGLRIELGEIEAQLTVQPGIREAAVRVREDVPGDKRLVAYLVGSSDGSASADKIDPQALRQALVRSLPEYMIPAAYVVLPALPKTPNGKLDAQALPAPTDTALVQRNYQAPEGAVETALAQIWSELLRVERVGRYDHFFELGGHSLLATQMNSRLRQRLGLTVAVTSLFAHPVLHALAAALADHPQSDTLPALMPCHRPEVLPLSFAQQRLWFIARMGAQASAAYNLSVALRLRGPLDEPALHAALDRIVQRHEALRTYFEVANDQPVQRIAPTSGFALVRHDLAEDHRPHADAVDAWRQVEASTRFDLEHGPLIRGRLLSIDVRDHVLLLAMHHIVSDGWSLDVLARELGALYRAYAETGVAVAIDPLQPLPVQYADYAVWQRAWLTGDVQQRQLAFWRTQLANAPTLVSLPTDRPRPAVQDYCGQSLEIAFDRELTEGLKALSQRHGTTLYMTLLAAWGALITRLAGQDEVVIGTPVANRTCVEVEPLIGFFVNTLALRMDLGDRPSVSQLLAQVRASALQAQSHQDVPFEQVVEALKPERTLAHSPIFQLMFAWQNTPQTAFELGDLGVEYLAPQSADAKFDLTLELQEAGDRIVGTLCFATALYDLTTMQRHLGYLEALLRGMVRDDAQSVDAIAIMDEAERHQLLTTWNDTARPYPQGLSVHALFERQAALTPQAVAIEYEGRGLSYQALDEGANRLAHQLRALGVDAEARVALCLRRSPDLVLAMLAVLKAGGAYVPLDPAAPSGRLRDMLGDCAPRVVLTQTALAAGMPASMAALGEWTILEMDAAQRPWDALPSTALPVDEVSVDPGQLAYVIYTSGSTGRPNGVMVEHRHLANLICWHSETFPLSPGERSSCTAGVAFDACTWEVWPALCQGATLALPPASTAGDPSALLAWWDAQDLQTSFLVTALADAALARGQGERQGLRTLLTGGDRLNRLPSADLPFALVNNYGPTEATVVATSGITRHDDTVIHIGRPIANTQLYLLDRHGQPVPMGAPGEIHIGGAQVARGYLNRPELTRERFLDDPFSAQPGARMYKTGDLGRWRPDGTVEYLGRNDHQVKIRGLRIELGEIESQLSRQPGLREVAVLAREDAPGEVRLVAYLVAADGAIPEAQVLRDALSQVLPEYMVPAAYVVLEALPLTANGKLDRRALPAPDGAAFAQRAYEAPEGEIEIALAQIWSELLRVEKVGRHDNFFELGGHSLLAMQLMERLRREGLSVDISAVFSRPTLAALAKAVEEASRDGVREVAVPANAIPPGCEAITPQMLPLIDLDAAQIACIVAAVPGGAANVQDIYPLAPLQEGILFHHLLEQDNDPYLLSITLGFDARTQLDGFVQALQQVIDRHDVLRTAVLWEGLDAPVQVVWRDARLDVQTLALGDEDIVVALDRDESSRRLDLRCAPLIRGLAAFDTRNQRWLLRLVHHHMVLDHTALDVMLQEIGLIMTDRAQELSEPVPFRNFVAQAKLGVSAQQHEAFFREMLGDVDEPTAPFGLMEVHGGGEHAHEAEQMLPLALSQRLRHQARSLGVSAASLFHWAWAQVLAKTTGRDDVVFGTVLFGRLQGGAGTDRAMGLFINTLPIRVRLGDTGVQDGILQTHATLSGLVGHEHASLALAQRCSALPASTPLFTAMLNYRHSTGEQDTSEWAPGTTLVSGQERSSYPLDLSVDDLGDAFKLTAQAIDPVDPQRMCVYMHNALERLAETLERAPQTPSWQIEVLGEDERHQLLVAWNDSPPNSPHADDCIQTMFERQAQATPQAIALEQGDDQLTYQELNERANRLARHLRALGVQPDERVAICLQRSATMMVAMLAVLKAGGGYVPLDPSYPQERLDYILQDSQPRVVLTQTALDVARMLGSSITVVDLDGPQRPWESLPATDLAPADPGLAAHHLAYVIYTSGSTGQPKGVSVEHGPLCRRIRALTERYGFQSTDRILQFASINFDVSIEEIMGALTIGATLVLRTEAWQTGAAQFWALCAESRITVAELPTKFWQYVTGDYAIAVPESVRIVIIGSEAVEARAIQDWAARPGHRPRLFNAYGPTEAVITATVQEVKSGDDVHIGQPVGDIAIYLLDRHDQPVPTGVAGEICIGGDGLARGYLDRPELTHERFVKDPFSAKAGARMYKTGDLGRWLADGTPEYTPDYTLKYTLKYTLEYLGRNDQQVKIRGFRIELGEIEVQLCRQPDIREAVVMARTDVPGEQRLVAYLVGAPGVTPDPQALRQALAQTLPDHMVPAAYVVLDALPLMPNGKVDRRALPAPDDEAFAQRAYEAPQGEVETVLAQVWSELLRVEKVGRNDNFFELGGHSLLAVQLMERLRREGLHADIRALFAKPTLAVLAQTIEEAERVGWRGVTVPANGIPAGCEAITPQMLPLVKLDALQIARIVAAVPGGAANVQDIYPLAPLQDGILFHHLLQTRGDAYLLSTMLSFDTRAGLDDFMQALQHVVDRHDVLRTAMHWEDLPEPVQVVWRKAHLDLQTLDVAEGEAAERLAELADPRDARMDVRQAPLMRGIAAFDTRSQRWLLLLLQHHLAMDHVAVELIFEEIGMIRTGRAQQLPEPVPFRNFVAQTRLGVSAQEHEAFFRQMLGDVDEPTAPFGMLEVHGDGENVHEAELKLPRALSQRLRHQARALGVSTASLFHWAWAQVLAKASGREDVVFGTVLFGRLQGGEGADRAVGLFMNSLPMRVHLGELNVQDGIRATHATLSGLVRHEHAPLALAQRCSALSANRPLFSALLNYRHTTPAGDTTPDWAHGVELMSVRERTNYSFTLSVDDLGEDFELRAQIEEPVEPQRVCAFMHNTLDRLAEALEHAPQTPSWQIEMLDATEQTRLCVDWNATERAYPQGCVHTQFEAQAARTPDAVALHYEDQRLSYAQLDAKASRLARYLLDAGVTSGARVGLYLSRSPELLIAVLAVLKAGAAYVPLEPKLPKDRLGYMVQDAGIGWALLEAAAMEELPLQGVDVILMDDAAREDDWLEDYAQGELPSVALSDVAYVIYTSGSTGHPKGVMVEHAGLSNYLGHAVASYLPGLAGSVVSSPLCFDATLTTLLPPLLAGKPVWLLPDETHTQTLARLSERLFAPGEGWLFKITPAHLDALSYLERDVALGEAPHCIVVGGEQLPSATLRRWKAELLPQASFVNEYGPTETVVGCSVWTLATAEQLPGLESSAATPIGRPIGNTQLYVLGANQQLQPIGSVGELYIGGAGVARGYLNRPELTRERFIANPFGAGRLYRTGDLVRYLGEGDLEFVGRIDDQVKIRGFRIELGEIEAQLMRQPGVREAAVLAREDQPGDKRLVAYLVAATHTPVELPALRQALAQTLPDYMVPAAYVVLEALPLTANGKLDRRALPAPGGSVAAQRDYVAPQGPLETALAGIWGDLLQIEQVGRYDSFFELGGQSLLVVRMISRVRQSLGLNLALSSVFAHPVLHDFARVAGETQVSALPALVPSTRPDDMPLSFAQQRLWLAAQFGEDASAAYHMPIGMRLRGRLDQPALRAALDGIVRRHEALRTYFELVDDQPVQRISAATGFGLGYQALDLDADQRDVAIEHWSGAEAREPFDLNRGPLFRGRLLRLDEQDHVLLLTLHHIVSDGWSLGVLADELSALYHAYSIEGVAPSVDPLSPLPVQYADYALWQRQCLDASMQAHLLGYWCTQLAGSPQMSTLPTDHPRPLTKGFVGGMVHAQIPQATTVALNELAARHSSTLFMVLMAAFNVVLSRYNGQTDLNVGTVVANRSRAEVEPLIGLFLDTQAIRTRLDPAQSFESLLQQVRATLIQAYLHQDLPFDKLLEELKPVRRPGVPPMFQVMVQMQSVPDPVVRLPELSMEELPLTEHTVKFDLTLYVNERGGAIDIAYEYDVALYDATTIERLAERFTRLLDAVAIAPQTRIDELGMPEALPAAAYEIVAVPETETRRGLSPHQQRLWSLDISDAGSVSDTAPTYHNMPMLLAFDEAVMPEPLEAALNVVIARHDALRTRITSDGQDVWQHVEPQARLSLAQIALEDGETPLARALADGVARPFLLGQESPIRAALLRDGDARSWLCIVVHHIVADRRSLQLLAQEVVTAYAAFAEGRTPVLPALPLGFGDHVRWQSTLGADVLEPVLMYWKQQLRGRLQPLELPSNRPRPALHSFTAGRHGFAIDAALGERLTVFAQDRAVTIEDALLAGFDGLLRRYSGHEELVVGTSVAGRNPSGVEAMVGPLASLLPLRTVIPAECDFETLLTDVARTRKRAMQHGDVPFDLLATRLDLGQDESRTGLLDVVFQYDAHAGQVIESGSVLARPVETNLGYGKYDLHLCMFPHDGGFEARLVYNADLFDDWLIAQMMRHYVRLLHEMAGEPQRRIDDVSLLDATEQTRLCVDWNATERAYPQSCVHTQFEAQAARTPDAVALHYEDERLSYAQLDTKASRLARYLLDAGVTSGARVGLYLSRSPELLIAVLGVLKAGAAYVPLEPKLPKERLGYMVQDAGIGWALLEAAAMEELPLQGVDVILMDDAAREDDWLEDYAQGELPSVALSDVAYVIYTSGSTGHPKGVMVEHAGLSNYLGHAVASYLPGLAGSVVSSPLCFDATLTTLLPPLLAGKPAWLLPDETHTQTLARLSEHLFAPGEGWLFKITPAHLDALSYLERDVALGEAPHCIVVGGEQLPSATLRRWKAELLPQASFVNEYGPTETVVGCSVWTLATAEQLPGLESSAATPIGRPIGNTQLYVLGANQQLQPIGSVGELYIGGAGVARGYLNRPELTRERFIANPFGAGRLYRTGDLVRYLGEGDLEFVGRIDDQVKIRGFRIELGEIEAQLMRQPGVREAAVLAREDQPGDKRLVAYVVAADGSAPDAHGLREALAQALPDYMVPAAYVMLTALPLTANGKLDRRALPAPGDMAFAQRDFEAPQGAIENMLAGIWSELLGVERVGRHDNFFELGGHSLLAVRLMGSLRRENLHIDIRALFAQPTLAALAEAVENAQRIGSGDVIVPANGIQPDCVAITPEMLPLIDLDPAQIERIVAAVPGGVSNVQDIYPLAPLQEGILFHHLLQTQGDAYLLSTSMAFDSRARLDAFVQALQQVIDRHDVLRTSVLWEGLVEPVQVVWRQAQFALGTPDLPEGDVATRLAELTDPLHTRLDVHQAPLMRGFAAYDEPGQRWLLQLVHHHLVLDHTALDVLLYEIGLILTGRAHELPEPVPFRNFVAQARLGVSAEEHEAFFSEMLGDVDEPTAPFGLLKVQGEGENVHAAELKLPRALSLRLRHQARLLGISTASLFHWAWAQVLAKTTGRDDVVFGTVLFGRLQGGAGAERAMGLFINTLPMRVRLGEIGVQDGIRQTHAMLSGLLGHEHASLALAQRCSALSASTPLFSAVMNYRHSVDEHADAETPDWAHGMEMLSAVERTNHVPFIMAVDDLGEDFELKALVDMPAEPQRVCAYMHNALACLVEALEHAPQTASWQIGILDEAERRQVLVDWNQTQRDWPHADACIHELFERQAQATPQALALAQGETRLSYQELNERANRLARHLHGLGVKPDDKVAICLQRSVEMVVAMLAVFKAGGAYVPLDPSYPQARLDHMLRDSRPRVLVTTEALQDQLPASPILWRTPVVDMTEAAQWQHHPHDDLGCATLGLGPAHLAYVIYTSGSTGVPKGVMATHRGLCNLSQAQIAGFGVDSDSRVVQFASFSFDACISEVVMALLSGASLHLPPPGVLAGAELVAWLDTHRITHATLPPALLTSLPVETTLPYLHTLILAGEATSAAQVKRWGQGRRLINAYGPTEGTVCASMHDCDVAATTPPPIGKPIANGRLYILDAHGRPAPIGVAGELHIAGVQVARGYLNNPQLTDERFVPDPFAAELFSADKFEVDKFAAAADERMYRTGDLARWRPDGTIDFLGRNDHQVKIRGFRIELGEIEAKLLAQTGVREALVLAREEASGDKQLVAYVADAAGAELDPQVLRLALVQALPDYMVPAAWVVLHALPVTPNGKIDRKALPLPMTTGLAQSAYEPPEGRTEIMLAQIWSELLGVERIGRQDHFFELGGHSLLATRLISRVRSEWDIEISLMTVFSNARLAEFSDAIVDCQLAQFDADLIDSIVAQQQGLVQ
jgi:amino acid adenylation domain-containing protein